MTRHTSARLATAAAIAALAVFAVCISPATGQFLGTKRVASDLHLPMYVTHAPGDPNRLFIAEKGGVIKILDLNTRLVVLPASSAAVRPEPMPTMRLRPARDDHGGAGRLSGVWGRPTSVCCQRRSEMVPTIAMKRTDDAGT